MASNNTSNICWQSDLFWTIGDYINFAQYVIILPTYCTVGLLGHIMCASAFLHQAKTEKAYVYQIYLEISEILDVSVFSIFLLAFLGGGVERPGYEWYLKIYIFMWYTAHLAIPLYNAMSMLCLLLSVSMAADRAFALIRPFVYKNINHKKHQRVALISCIVLSFGTTIFNIRLFEVQNDDDGNKYKIGVDADYVGTLTSVVLSHACNVTRMIGLLALVGCNISILKSYRQVVKQKAKVSNASLSNDKEAKEKAKERSLILLTVSQSFFTTILMFSYVVFYTAVYVVPLFNICDHLLYAPLLNSIIMLCDLGSTCTVLALNQKSRAMFWKVLSIFKCWNRVNALESSTVLSTHTSKHSTVA